jgi:cold shock CspA family protein
MSGTETTETVYQGRVKWFNNKAGYGFITVIDGVDVGDKVGMDIFAHHSAICVHEEQYKYLVQGEYIEFTLSSVESKQDYQWQASNIKGMKGGRLLCETRNENRTVVTKKASNDNSKNGRNNKGSAMDEDEEDEEWVLTRKNTKSKQTSPSKSQES